MRPQSKVAEARRKKTENKPQRRSRHFCVGEPRQLVVAGYHERFRIGRFKDLEFLI